MTILECNIHLMVADLDITRGHVGSTIQYKKVSEPACRHLKVSSCISAITSILSKPFSLIQVARCSSIVTLYICFTLCNEASSPIQISLRTHSRIIAEFAIMRGACVSLFGSGSLSHRIS